MSHLQILIRGASVITVPQLTLWPTSGVIIVLFLIIPRFARLAARLCRETKIPSLMFPSLGKASALYPSSSNEPLKHDVILFNF